MNNVKAAHVSLTVNNDTDTASIAATGDVDKVSRVELNEVNNLVLGNGELDCVVDLDEGVRVANGASVVCDEVGDSAGSEHDSLDFAELVLLSFVLACV